MQKRKYLSFVRSYNDAVDVYNQYADGYNLCIDKLAGTDLELPDKAVPKEYYGTPYGTFWKEGADFLETEKELQDILAERDGHGG